MIPSQQYLLSSYFMAVIVDHYPAIIRFTGWKQFVHTGRKLLYNDIKLFYLCYHIFCRLQRSNTFFPPNSLKLNINSAAAVSYKMNFVQV